ncbi:MAG: two-component regulator propeller domain-containing protein [Prolixibacteraceae bacterium]
MQNKSFKYILLFLPFICTSMLWGANYDHLNGLEFSVINQKNGLASNNVNCIIKDSDGFMWFGTRNGLCRYDGYEIKTYTSNDLENSLSGNRILSIAEDSDHMLWVGTYNSGLNRFNKTSNSFEHFGLKDEIGARINNIKVLADYSVWICSNNGLALYQKNSNNFKSFEIDPNSSSNLPSKIIYDLFECENGDLYVTCESDFLYKFDRKNELFTKVEYQRSPDLQTNYNKHIAEDDFGNLWIAANSHGICKYNPQSGESILIVKGQNQISTNLLTGDLRKGPDGKIWVCTDGGGINVIDPKTHDFKYITANEGINHLNTNTFYSLFFDESERLWLGSFDKGIFCFDPEKDKFTPTLYRSKDLAHFNNKSILSLYQDSKYTIWVGTDGDGLYQIKPNGSIKNFLVNPMNENSISSNVITALNEDPNGNILIGTYSGGLNVFNVNSEIFTHHLQKAQAGEKINSSSIWNICRDSHNMVWLGLLADGLALYNPLEGSFENLGPSSSSPQKVDFPNVMAIMEDADGDIWYGTEGKGLFILDQQSKRVIKPGNDTIRHISTQGIIKCIYQDHWENIWVGTEGKGLVKYNKSSKEYRQFTIQDGLPSNIIQSIIEDQSGNLWLGTTNGLSVMDGNTFEFRNFIESDGLSGNEFNQNASIKLNDSRILLGTSKGLDIFNPEKIRINQQLPKVVFTKLSVLNKEIQPQTLLNNKLVIEDEINAAKTIKLSYKEKTFTIEFAALNYTLPEKCKYAYQLEGYDEDWNYTESNNRFASYSNLDAGIYLFKVKASNNDGLWGKTEHSIQITILPPFYKTIWFRSLLLILLLVIAYFIYSYRLNILKNRFMQKEIEQERKIMILENEQLDAELQKLTFHILNRNRALIDQKNRLLGLSTKAKESVRNGLQEIIHQFDEELSDDKDWKYIEPQLDKVYNNFVSKLKKLHPDLTLTEIKIAAYVRMNLTTKEITEFMHKTPRAVENDRYRLRKKIGLNTNDSLQHYLINI